MNLYTFLLLPGMLLISHADTPAQTEGDQYKVAGYYTRPQESLIKTAEVRCTYGEAYTKVTEEYLYLLDDGSYTMGCQGRRYDNINHTSADISCGFFSQGFWNMKGRDTIQLENKAHQPTVKLWRKDCNTLKELPINNGIPNPMANNNYFTRKTSASK